MSLFILMLFLNLAYFMGVHMMEDISWLFNDCLQVLDFALQTAPLFP